MSLKSQTVHGVVWSFIERFSVQIVQFVLGIIIARLLSPDEYGLIGMLAIFISISQVVSLLTLFLQISDKTFQFFHCFINICRFYLLSQPTIQPRFCHLLFHHCESTKYQGLFYLCLKFLRMYIFSNVPTGFSSE